MAGLLLADELGELAVELPPPPPPPPPPPWPPLAAVADGLMAPVCMPVCWAPAEEALEAAAAAAWEPTSAEALSGAMARRRTEGSEAVLRRMASMVWTTPLLMRTSVVRIRAVAGPEVTKVPVELDMKVSASPPADVTLVLGSMSDE